MLLVLNDQLSNEQINSSVNWFSLINVSTEVPPAQIVIFRPRVNFNLFDKRATN